MNFKAVLAHLKLKIFSVGQPWRPTLKLAELTYSFWIRPCEAYKFTTNKLLHKEFRAF